MTGNNLDRAAPWLQSAQNDRDAGSHLRDGSYWSLACFHCQQSAEKALKAFLRAHGESDVTGHGLSSLCRRCQEHDEAFASVREACLRLGRHYVTTRYPDAVGDESPEEHYLPADAKTALDDADHVLALVREKVEQLRTDAAGCEGEAADGVQ